MANIRIERWADLRVRVAGGTDGRGGGDGPVVVLLHGYGASGDDLVGLAGMLQAPAGTRFVFPEAPLVSMGGGRAWWQIDLARLDASLYAGVPLDRTEELPDELPAARERVRALLEHLGGALSVPERRLVIGGFSQGAMLACDVALHEDRHLAGLALLSGTLIARAKWAPLRAARAGLRTFVSHGRADPLLAFGAAEKLTAFLAEGGLRVEFHAFRGGHEIPPQVLDTLGAFLVGNLGATAEL